MSHMQRLNKVHNEITYQPNWRGESDRCHQYYDGKQLEPDVVQMLKARSQPILITNLMAPAINGVLGMEARTRTDWFVSADDDDHTELSEALNVRVGESLRMAKANRACSDAYHGQLIGGLSWVEVKKNKDPLGAKFSIKNIHRDEISWDWKADSDLSNCRWLLRQRWVDADEVTAVFPGQEDIINHAIGQWSNFDEQAFNPAGDLLSKAYDEYQYSTQEETEWLNPSRDMVKVYELYYRVWESGIILKDGQGNVTVYNEKNPVHVAAVNSGKFIVERRLIPSMRLSWYVGPHHMVDGASPHPHNHFPYVPFFGSREDKTKIPYGLGRAMLSPQDEINFRRIKLTAQLNYKRVVMDEDATKMSDEDVSNEIHRPDGIIKLDPNAKRKGGARFTVETDQGIAQQQFAVMQDAKDLIQDVAGIYNALLGKDGGAKSGVAINSLVEQGTTTLADINDNYLYSRQMVGELVMAHEIEELKTQKNVQVAVPGKRMGEKPKQVIINEELGNGEISNAINVAKTQVVMGELNQSAGYRAQVGQMLMDFVSKLPPELQVGALDIVVEQLDLPEDKKERLMKVVQKATGGVNPEEMSEDEKAAFAQQQEKAAVLEQIETSKLQLSLEQIKEQIAKLVTDNEFTQAKTNTEVVKADKEVAITEKIRQEVASGGPQLPPRAQPMQ